MSFNDIRKLLDSTNDETGQGVYIGGGTLLLIVIILLFVFFL